MVMVSSLVMLSQFGFLDVPESITNGLSALISPRNVFVSRITFERPPADCVLEKSNFV